MVVRKADYGIPGITKVYEARLTNYGILPRRITVCDFIDDAMSHGTLVGSTIEKWDASGRRWESVFHSDKSTFCQPYPLGMIETHIILKRLWPSQSISGGEEATAARDVFAIGDKARFILFRRGPYFSYGTLFNRRTPYKTRDFLPRSPLNDATLELEAKLDSEDYRISSTKARGNN